MIQPVQEHDPHGGQQATQPMTTGTVKPARQRGKKAKAPAVQVQPFALDPGRAYLCALLVPDADWPAAKIQAAEVQRQLAPYGVRTVIVLPESWRALFEAYEPVNPAGSLARPAAVAGTPDRADTWPALPGLPAVLSTDPAAAGAVLPIRPLGEAPGPLGHPLPAEE